MTSNRVQAKWSPLPRRVSSLIAYFLVLACASTGSSADPQEPLRLLTLAPEETPDVVARWNDAVQQVSDGDWPGLLEVLHPRERALWSNESDAFELLSLFFGERIDEERNPIVVYQAPDGAGLARVYAERQRVLDAGGTAAPLRERRLLGTLTRAPNRPWLIDLSTRDNFNFGLDCAVEGLRLSVSPSEQTVDSWKDLRLAISLENVGDAPVEVLPEPSFYLQSNLTLGLLQCSPPESVDAFRELTAALESTSAPPVSGLLASIQARPTPLVLNPGESQEHDLSLRTLCWQDDAIPDGPSGTFDLFVVYDAALEHDPVQAALPVWRYRTATASFRVTVRENPSK